MSEPLSEYMNGHRRRFLVSVGGACVASLSGCLGDGGEGESTDHGDEDDTSEPSEEARSLAESFVDAIDDELSVTESTWRGPQFVPEYEDSGGLETDVTVMGEAYADVVDEGFDHQMMPTAMDDDGVDFMVFLEPEWAAAYVDEELSETEYHAEIEESEH